MPQPPETEASLQRLYSLQRSDPGFFVLGVHSFVEAVLRSRYSDEMDYVDFGYLVNWFTEKEKSMRYVPNLESLKAMSKAHFLTNEVRHNFAILNPEDAQITTQHLISFCEIAKINSPAQLDQLLVIFESWNNRQSVLELENECKRLRNMHTADEEEIRAIREASYQGCILENRITVLENDKREALRKAENLVHAADSDRRREKLARRKLADKELELKEARQKLEEHLRASEYLLLLKRLLSHTRTRSDFERMIMKLSPDQEGALGQITFDRDCFLSGGPGTGKTLILLKAMATYLAETNESDTHTAIFLTYGKPLNRYEKYLASVLNLETVEGRIQTADTYILKILRCFVPDAQLDFMNVRDIPAQSLPKGIDSERFRCEAMELIWPHTLDCESYVGWNDVSDERIKAPETRKAIWEVVKAFQEKLLRERKYTKPMACHAILDSWDTRQVANKEALTGCIFIDEAQDLTQLEYRVFKKTAKNCIIAAGDEGQSIYQLKPGFRQEMLTTRPMAEAQPITLELSSNYRNTIAIRDLAFQFLEKRTQNPDPARSVAVRSGPPPELHCAANKNKLRSLIAEQVQVLLTVLGYAPRNIAIIAPHGNDLDPISKALEKNGIPSIDIRKEDCDFIAEDKVRITTFHSAKGLDFPVVLLFLYEAPQSGTGYSDVNARQISTNLIHVGITRAMDYLQVFMLDRPGTPILEDLRSLLAPHP